MWRLEAYPKDGIYLTESYEVRGITDETVERIVEYWGEHPPVWARENPVPDGSVAMLIPFIDEPFVQRPDWDYFLGYRGE
ncbi:MAG: hypothetical protein LLG14_13615 [Nocardiaceae bacterium]|nr:hypothetical protein [Nocardiaceae bacterium]